MHTLKRRRGNIRIPVETDAQRRWYLDDNSHGLFWTLPKTPRPLLPPTTFLCKISVNKNFDNIGWVFALVAHHIEPFKTDLQPTSPPPSVLALVTRREPCE